MVERAVLKRNAKEQLKGKWGLAIGTLLVGEIISNGLSCITSAFEKEDGTFKSIATLVSLLLTGVIAFGICKFTLNIATKKNAAFNDLFSGFKIYLKTLGLYFLMIICIGLASLVFIIPGIIVGLMFSQAFFILCENNEKSVTECLKESSAMMKGHKVEMFILALSFIGWWILAVITFGIIGLWVLPYQQVTFTNYYLEIKGNKAAEV